MLEYSVVLEAYEELCLGKRPSLQLPESLSAGPKKPNPKRTKNLVVPRDKEAAVLYVIRYAITRRLGWTKQEAYDHLTPDIMRQLKIDMLVKYINLPSDIDWETDTDYIVARAFGDNFDYSSQVMRVYNRILAGGESKFPKNMFKEAASARFKCAVLIHHFISRTMYVRSIPELYARFADTPRINALLKSAKIRNVVDKLYDTPLDCIHYSLSDYERDPFLYGYYSFMRIYGMAEKDLRAKDA